MSVAKDLTGMTFGEWTVLERAENSKSGHSRWLCRCSCGTKIKVLGNSLLNGKSKCCGCFDNLIGKTFGKWFVLKRESNNKNKNPRWLCRCECGTEKIIVGSALKNGKSKSCRDCSMFGENHPKWNPNLTDEERELNKLRSYPEYIQWRKEVFIRDSYTCQVCNKHGGTLNAHHIESYTTNPELRTALSNGITLCEECHKNFHHQYGYGNNTKAQLNEFSEVS